MAFTDHCDIFASFHEDGLNAILRHVRQQRPSLFNYGSLGVIANPALLCRPIGAHPVVTLRNNPLMTQIDPLPIPGTSFAMELAVQVTDVRMDFHPGQLHRAAAGADTAAGAASGDRHGRVHRPRMSA